MNTARRFVCAFVLATCVGSVSRAHALPAPAEPAPAPAAAAAPAAAPAPAVSPAPTPQDAPSAAVPTAAPATEAPPEGEAAPASAATAATTAPPQSDEETFRARLALERERLRLMLARARMARGLPVTRPKEEPVVHGDAGAAIAIGACLEQIWYPDASYDLFATDNVTPRFGLWLGHDLLSLRADVILAAEIGWGYENENKSAFGGEDALDTKLRTHTFDGGVRVRWVPIDFLQPHVRVAGGLGWVRANLAIDNGRVGSESDELLPFVSAGLGFLLRTPTRAFENRRGDLASLSLGIMVEGGYTQAAGLDVSFRAKRDERAIDLVEPDLGTLERSGPYLRTSFVVGF